MQVLRMIAAAASFGALFGAAEVVHLGLRVSPELTRRLVHVAAGLMAALLPLFLSLTEIVVLGLAFTAFMAVSRRTGLLRAIHDVRRATLGEIFFPLGVAAVAAIAPDRAHYAFGVLVMGVSDGLAGAVGQRFGRRTYHVLRATKSYLGSAVFAACTATLGAIALTSVGETGATAVSASLLAAAALTAIEGVLPIGVDNLVLPPLASVSLFGLAAVLS